MAKFHKLRVLNIIKETADCVSFGFDIPENLKSDYKFKQGQYLTLKLNIGGDEIRRCYSICTSPISDDEVRVAAKKVKGGRGSTWLNDTLKEGDEIEVMTPMGNFYTELDASNSKTYVLLAGGSGITPIMSILKSILDVEQNSNVVLFYGNLNESAAIFKNELDSISDKSDNAKVYHILDQPEGEVEEELTGMMTKEKMNSLLKKHIDLQGDNEYFLCGPPGMKDGVLECLEELKLDPEKIHVEVFTFDTVKDTEAADNQEALQTELFCDCKATIIIDDEEHEVAIESGTVVLQAALDAGLDASFSCRGGMCMTCRAKLVDGKVKMKLNYALTDKEIELGYILTCQSQPTTATITVNYDEGL